MKRFFISSVVLCTLFVGFGVLDANELPEDSFRDEELQEKITEEAIMHYGVTISVNTDNSISIIETIRYRSGFEEKHGIFRDIYPFSSQDWKMDITDIEVTDEVGSPYIFEKSNQGKNIRLKIGDPDTTFTGEKTYVIKYRAVKAVAQFEDLDEIYWNATGNEWSMPIYDVEVSVILPSKIEATQYACYQGTTGSTESCDLTNNEGGIYVFKSTRELTSWEGMSVAVGFPKGIVNMYTDKDKVSNFFERNKEWFWGAILPFLTLIISLGYWFKKGRDPKGRGIIVPQYDVPKELTPLEVGAIINQDFQNDYISAEIIYLATKGYIKINQLEEKYIGLLKTTDYELVKLKEWGDLTNDFDKKLMMGLFESNYRALSIVEKFAVFKDLNILDTNPEKMHSTQSVKLSELKYTFSSVTDEILTSAADSVLNKGYYDNLSKSRIIGIDLVSAILVLLFLTVFGGIFLASIFEQKPFISFLSVALSGLIYIIISRHFPKKTKEGVVLEEQLLGLKEYLKIAEKNRLEFHNAPEKKPEIFEKLLPYAMVMGVADIWAKEFEGIYSVPPSWYSTTSTSSFNATSFVHSLSKFSSVASSSFSSRQSSGGGSSGSGGGGGGGSW